MWVYPLKCGAKLFITTAWVQYLLFIAFCWKNAYLLYYFLTLTPGKAINCLWPWCDPWEGHKLFMHQNSAGNKLNILWSCDYFWTNYIIFCDAENNIRWYPHFFDVWETPTQLLIWNSSCSTVWYLCKVQFALCCSKWKPFRSTSHSQTAISKESFRQSSFLIRGTTFSSFLR